MHSHIIIHPDLDQGLTHSLSLAQLTNPSPDLQLISPDKQQSIGIDQIRQLIPWLSISPLQAPTKYAIITHGHLLTQEAQQSLLKTLEEPPADSAVILIASSTHNLLPTIISRCQIHNFVQTQNINPDQLIQILQTQPLNRFALTNQYKDKPSALKFIHNLIDQSHQLLQTNPSFATIAIRLLQTQNHLQSNAHITLTLDYLWLDLPVIK